MAASKNTSLRFTKLKLTNWRNFKSAEISLGRRAFFVGPNASGKSNLLDSIRFLSELAQDTGGGLQAAVTKRGGFSALRCLHNRAPSYVEIEVFIGTDEKKEMWRYLLNVNVEKKGKPPTVLREIVQKDGKIISSRTKSEKDDPLEYSQTLIEQVSESKKFKELLEFLQSCRYLHVVPQIVRERSRAKAEGDDPFGGDLLRRMKEMPKKTRDPRMRRISEALKIAVPQFRDINLEDDSEGVPHLYASFEHWRFTPHKQSEMAFSDGTLRLIGLLWSIAEKGGPLLLEEPELSLNDAVIGEIPRMFLKMQKLSLRQVIATTHSASLLDDPSIGLEEVHRIFVGRDGSSVETTARNHAIRAQVDNGLTVSQAVLPLVRPRGVDKLGDLEIAS